MHVPRHFASIWHGEGVFLIQLARPAPLETTLDRLESRGLAKPILDSTVTVVPSGPVLHTVHARCINRGALSRQATVRELVQSPACRNCSWQSASSQGKVLSLASWWFALADLTACELDRSWRTAMLLHAATGPAALAVVGASSEHASALDPLRRQVVSRATEAVDQARSLHGDEVLHSNLAALAYAHPVTPSQSREFSKWAVSTATMARASGLHHAWNNGLRSSLGPPVQVLATRVSASLAWAQSFTDSSDISAMSEFYPSVLLTPLSRDVATGCLPELTAAGLVQLGFDVVAARGVAPGVLEMAAQLFDASRATELGDLGTALAAALSITS